MSQNQVYRYISVLAIYMLMQFSSVLLYFFNPFTAFNWIPEEYTTEQATQFISGQWGFYSFLIATIFIVLLTYKDFFQSNPNRSNMSNDRVFLWTIGGILLAFITQICSGLILTNLLDVQEASENTTDLIEIAKLTPIFIPVICIFAPILEEIVFRGILFKAVADKTNFFVGVLLSTLVFAWIHNDFTYFIAYFMMGLVFAFLYYKTNRLIVPIIVHAVMNSFVVIAQLTYGDLLNDIQNQMQMIVFF